MEELSEKMLKYIREHSDPPKDPEEWEAMQNWYEYLDDPNNISIDKWNYLIETWQMELFRIHDLTGFEDGSYLFESLLKDLKEYYETPIVRLIDIWKDRMRTFTPDMIKWHSISTKEEFEKEFPYYYSTDDEKVKKRLSKKQYFEFFKKVESDSYTPSKYTKQDNLILKGSSIREFRRQYIRKEHFDDTVPEACEMLTDEKNMDENELLEILRPPSKYYADALLERVIYHFTNPNGYYYRKTHQLKVGAGAKKNKIFVVDRKDQC